jgi:hypothetical protein
MPHAVPICAPGACAIGSCEPGWTDCNAKRRMRSELMEPDLLQRVRDEVHRPNQHLRLRGLRLDVLPALDALHGSMRRPGNQPAILRGLQLNLRLGSSGSVPDLRHRSMRVLRDHVRINL